MPAIQLARLKIQAAQLAEHFTDPPAFGRALDNLLDDYADHVRRAGQSGTPPPLLPAYHVPPPVLRQVMKELTPRAIALPEAALLLCDRLWSEPKLEFRLLAALLLGCVPPQPPRRIFEKVESWVEPEVEDRLLRALASSALTRARQEFSEVFSSQLEIWLSAPTLSVQRLGLLALLPLVNDASFGNIPLLYRWLTPLTRAVPLPLREDLVEVLQALAQRSPRETVHFFQQVLSMPDNPDTAWLMRKTMTVLPKQWQTSLHEALKEAAARKR